MNNKIQNITEKIYALQPDFIKKIRLYNTLENYGNIDNLSEIDTSELHEICNLINNLKPFGKASQTKLKLLVSLYKSVPDYSILIYMRQNYNSYSQSSKKFYWRMYRKWMTDGQTFSNPVKYSLECDWFTDKQSAETAWKEITAKPFHEIQIKNIISCWAPIAEDERKNFINKISEFKKLKFIFNK